MSMTANVRDVVTGQVTAVAAQYGKTLAPLTDHLMLLESGLDSLCIAVLIAKLEDQLGVDPFGSGDDAAVPMTVGDLIRVYENAVS